MRPRRFGIGGGRWNRHQTDDLEVLEGSELSRLRGQRRRLEAVLALLAREIDFDQSPHPDSTRRGLGVERVRDLEPIDGVEDGVEIERLLDLVRLQGTEQVPLDIGGQRRRLGQPLLDAVLAEAAQARRVGLPQRRDRLNLRRADQSNARGVAAGPRGGRRDAAPDRFQPRRDAAHAGASLAIMKRLQPSHWTTAPWLRISTATWGRTR